MKVSSIRRGQGVCIRLCGVDRRPNDLYRCISHFNDLRLRRLIKDSLIFTCSIFPLPGYIIWLDASLGVSPRFIPSCYQRRMGAIETALDTGLKRF